MMIDHQHALSRRDSLKLLATLAAASALPTSSLLAATRRAQSTILDWTPLPKPVHGYHIIADLATGGNTLIASHDEQAILIDTKFASYGLALRQDAQTLNKGNPDLTLINTHHHGDHTGGNAFVIPQARQSFAQTNAVARIQSQLDQAIGEAKSAPQKFMESGASRELIKLAQRTADLTDQINKDTVTPKNTFDKSTMFEHATVPVALHHFGAGHTDNDIIVHFQDDNIIHMGDLVFAGLHPFFFPSHGATALGWIESLTKVYELTDKDTQIIPGHGQPGDRSLIKDQINYLTQLIEHVQKEIDAGTPKDTVAEMSWDFMDGLGFEQIRSRAINAVYDELSN